MKELEMRFSGTGEVKGYKFEQTECSVFAYIYKKTHMESGNVSYEVFKRVENRQFDCVSYPKSKSFGVWAWEYSDHLVALERFMNIHMREKSKLEQKED